MISELNDYETMLAALQAAETGHVVFGTLHTNDAKSTVSRIISAMPDDMKNDVKNLLANNLLGVMSQVLLPTLQGGRIMVPEVLIKNSSIASHIRKDKLEQITSAIQTGGNIGMCSLDDNLCKLVKERVLHKVVALESAINRVDLERRIRDDEG